MASVELERIGKNFGDAQVIRDVSLDVRNGEFIVLVGPSGCGKSTLLRLISGLDQPTVGKIGIDGSDATHRTPVERGIAMVFQSYALYPHMTVAQNIGFRLKQRRLPKADIANKVAEVAAILRIEQLLERRPKDLSGGQRQRVAIGRAIVRNPSVFLLDEPLSNLDAALRADMRTEIRALHERLKTTMIYVTHDQVEAMTMADRIVVLRAGRIEQVGTPREIYSAPANRFVAQFVGSPSINIINCSVEEEPDGGAVAQISNSCRIDLPVQSLNFGDRIKSIGIRPESWVIAASSSQAAFTGTITEIEDQGGDMLVTVVSGDVDPVVWKTGYRDDLNVGSILSIRAPVEEIHMFDNAGNRVAVDEHVK